MSTTSKLFDLEFNYWHQWEQVAKTEINQFKDAGSEINRGIKFISTQLSRPLTIEYMEDYMDGAVVKSRKAHPGMRTEIGQPFINSRLIIIKLCKCSIMNNNKLYGHL